METRALYPLWPRLHEALLRCLEEVPPGGLAFRLPGETRDLGSLFREAGAREDYWRRVILERADEPRPITQDACPDGPSIRARLVPIFEATERLLAGSLVEALVERPVAARQGARNALEALGLAYLGSVEARALVACSLRSLGRDPGVWP